MTELLGREPKLTTRRLTLRLPAMGDAERVALLLNNFAVSGNLSRVPYPYHLSDAKAYLKLRKPGLPPHETGFAIDLEGVGFIGQVGYHTDVHGATVLGYYLGQPFWGRGGLAGDDPRPAGAQRHRVVEPPTDPHLMIISLPRMGQVTVVDQHGVQLDVSVGQGRPQLR